MTDLTRVRGDTAADLINVQNSEGVVIDVTGFSFLLSVNSLENPPSVVTQLYQIIGTILDAVNGVVEFAPTVGDAGQLPATYYYDIQMIDVGGRIRTIEKGEYVYTQDITK